MKKNIYWKMAGASTLALGLAMLAGGCNNAGGGGDTIATVGGENVSRNELYQHLEATHGPDGLQQLIDYNLVLQNLKSKGLEVSESEVSAAIAERQAKDPEIAKIVAGQGPRLRALERQVRYQLAIDKLLTQDVKVDQNQLKTWFEKTREYYDTPESVKIGILRASTKTRADLMAQQLKSNSKSFLELVNEQQKANDPAARASIAEVPEMITINNMPDPIREPISKLQKGQTSGVIATPQVGPDGQTQTMYSIIRLADRIPAKKADFAKLQPQLDEDYKMEQVARRVVAQVPNVTWEQIIPQVRDQVSVGQATPPTYSQMLQFITTQLPTVPAFQQAGVISPVNQLIQSLRTSANVTINDTDFQTVGEIYKPVPGVGGAPDGNAAPAAAPAAGNAAP